MIEEIHEPGCICTGCLTGRATSLDCATPGDVADMLAGRVENWTGAEPIVRILVTIGDHEFEVPFDRLCRDNTPAEESS